MPMCESHHGSVLPGLRLAKFVGAFGGRGGARDLCATDLVGEFQGIGEAIVERMTSACVPAPASDCQILAGGTVPVPVCAPEGPRPCWRIDPSPECARMGLRFVISG